MDLLTPAQRALVSAVARLPQAADLYLSGGTALSACYLRHRLSEDLDFFSSNPVAIREIPRTLPGAAPDFKLEFRRAFDTFVQCYATGPDGEPVKLDFAVDTPFQLGERTRPAGWPVTVDDLEDVSANKLSALFDRTALRDYVDVFFICRDRPFDDLLAQARRKHIGIDDYWLARALERVPTDEPLPRMLRPLDPAAMRDFFLARAAEAMDRAVAAGGSGGPTGP